MKDARYEVVLVTEVMVRGVRKEALRSRLVLTSTDAVAVEAVVVMTVAAMVAD